MKITISASAEQRRVLSSMIVGVKYGSRDLRCNILTLQRLYDLGLVSEDAALVVLVWFKALWHRRQNHLRRFEITPEGVRMVLRTPNIRKPTISDIIGEAIDREVA